MAIKLNYTTRHKINLPEAYIRLHKLNTNRTNVNMEFVVYQSEQTFLEGVPFIEMIQKNLGSGTPEIPETFDENGNIITEAIPEVIGMENYFSIELLDGNTNSIKQAYIYLSSLPEFVNGEEI